MSQRTPRRRTRAAFVTCAVLALSAATLLAGRAAAAAAAQDKGAAPKAPAATATDPKAAAPKPAAPALAAAPADDTVVLPFIGPDTNFVGRLDVHRIDLDALEKIATGLGAKMAGEFSADSPEEIKAWKAEMAEATRGMRKGLAEFVGAGGRHVYFTFDPGEFTQLMVTPLGPGADAAKLEELFAQWGAYDDTDITSVRVGDVLVSAEAEGIEAMKQRAAAFAAAGGKPAEGAARPDLPKAFAAAGDAWVRLAYLPGEAGRAAIEGARPELPEELGGGDVKLVSRGVLWAALGVAQKPALAIRATVHAADAEQAKALTALFAKAVESIRADLEPDEPEAKALAAVKPALRGQTITFDVDASLLPVFMFAGASAEIEVDEDDAPAKPAKPDDGGL